MTMLIQEVTVIWQRRWTAMTWLYAFTRYSTAINCIIFFVPVDNIIVRHHNRFNPFDDTEFFRLLRGMLTTFNTFMLRA